MNLDSLNLVELQKLIQSANERVGSLRQETVRIARAAARAAVESHGVTWEEAFPSASMPRRNAAAPSTTKGQIKYRNPANAANTWTGRGRKPAWFVEALAAGTKAEDLLA